MLRFVFVLPAAVLLSCSSTPVGPEGGARDSVQAPAPDSRARLPHPQGHTVSELRAMLERPGAPSAEELARCDFDYGAEKKLARSKEEFFTAFPHHVRSAPERYHWCFYSRLLSFIDLAGKAGEKDLGTERQQKLLESYLFIAHLARIFQTDFDDARYLRQAVHHYRTVSQSVYLQSLKPSPETLRQLEEQEPGAVPTKSGMLNQEPER